LGWPKRHEKRLASSSSFKTFDVGVEALASGKVENILGLFTMVIQRHGRNHHYKAKKITTPVFQMIADHPQRRKGPASEINTY
jgi:hypothetical protein